MLPVIEVCFTINDQYVKHVVTTIYSILHSNQKNIFRFYIICDNLSEDSRSSFSRLSFRFKGRCSFEYCSVDTSLFSDIKLSIDYISIHTYYRFMLADLLSKSDKILYLDADILVQGDLLELWETNLEDYYAAGVADLYIDKIDYKKEIGFSKNDFYINAGVILFNLDAIRWDNISKKLLSVAKELSEKVRFQDQDILNIVFRDKIKVIPDKFNFTMDNMQKYPNQISSAVILHYNGGGKPWHGKRNRPGFKQYYEMETLAHKKIRVALVIDEFFGAVNTAFGGYGFLARKFIAKYIPCADIQIDVLLGKGKRHFFAQKFSVDGVTLYRLPRRSIAAKYWLKRKNYDIYLSIELTDDYVLKYEDNPNKKLILWIQDPRPKYEWENTIDTMQSIKDPCFYRQSIYDLVHKMNKNNRVKLISQGYSLNPLAMQLYNLPKTTPIQYIPNPIEIDFDFRFDIREKRKNIIFLGRIEAQKRAWLFCEIAKRMPDYDFYVLGSFFRHQKDNKRMLQPYMNGDIKNLYFMGHVDGGTKKELIKSARILLSTSIWEGIPISWLECLSYGTCIVSCLEREKLVTQFGGFVGEILGDGFDDIDKFIPAIRELIENDTIYSQKAEAAIQYVRNMHNISKFINDLRNVIFKEMYK
jgi:lipopolysaccharide biosynthesis glycosyltransferase